MPELDASLLKKKLDYSERKRAMLQKKLAARFTEEDGFAWSMADLMTLLLIFFILFYAHAAARINKEGPREATDGIRIQALFSWKDTIKTPDAAQAVAASEVVDDVPLEDTRQAVMSSMSLGPDSGFSTRMDDQRLIFILGEKITFSAGEADLLSESHPALRKIARAISEQKDCLIVVSGHTDDIPINTPRYPSNWELSVARAVNVAKILIQNGVAPDTLTVEGHAANKPLAPNDTVEHRQINRRVEIALTKSGPVSAQPKP